MILDAPGGSDVIGQRECRRVRLREDVPMEAESSEGFEDGGGDREIGNVPVLWKPGEEMKQIPPQNFQGEL